TAFSERVGETRVWQLPSGADALARGGESVATRYPFAFGERLTLEEIERGISRGGLVRTVRVAGLESSAALRKRVGQDFRPLIEVGRGGGPVLVRSPEQELRPGSVVVGIDAPLAP